MRKGYPIFHYKHNKYFIILIFILIYFLKFPYGTNAQDKNVPGQNPSENTVNADNKSSEYEVITEITIDLPENQIQAALGGGYFLPLGDMSGVLDPNWCLKGIVRINNVQGTLFGLGFDLSYAGLRDMEYDGNFYYVTALPHATATIPVFNIVQLQAKGCAGFSALYSKINEVSDGSLCLTLGAGIGFFRVFAKHYMIGLDYNFIYYFQMHTSTSMSGYFYLGYNF